MVQHQPPPYHLTEASQARLDRVTGTWPLPPDWDRMRQQMLRAAQAPLRLTPWRPASTDVWQEFSAKYYDVHPNRFTRWLETAECYGMTVDGVQVWIWGRSGVLVEGEQPWEEDDEIVRMAQICALIHIWVGMIGGLEGIQLYIALYPEERTLPPHPSRNGGLSVSGLTIHDRRLVFCTKRQDICRLLLHELAHYARLDQYLHRDMGGPIRTRRSVYPSEVWAEYVSVYLHTLWVSIQTGLPGERLWRAELEHNQSVIYNLAGYWETTPEEVWAGEVSVNPSIPVLEYVWYRYLLLHQSVPIVGETGEGVRRPEYLHLSEYHYQPVLTESRLLSGDVSYSTLELGGQ